MGKVIAVVLMSLVAGCVTDDGGAAPCGAPPTIDDADFGISANGDGTVTMTEERYAKTREYILRTRAWTACIQDCDPASDKLCDK